MRYCSINIITIDKGGHLIHIKSDIFKNPENPNQLGILYSGDFYEIDPTKILLDKDNHNRPTIIILPYLNEITHTLSKEQWQRKLDAQLKVIREKGVNDAPAQ